MKTAAKISPVSFSQRSFPSIRGQMRLKLRAIVNRPTLMHAGPVLANVSTVADIMTLFSTISHFLAAHGQKKRRWRQVIVCQTTHGTLNTKLSFSLTPITFSTAHVKLSNLGQLPSTELLLSQGPLRRGCREATD